MTRIREEEEEPRMSEPHTVYTGCYCPHFRSWGCHAASTAVTGSTVTFIVCQPSVLFLHVGENDLEDLTSPEIAHHLCALVNYIISLSHPRAIIISQLLWFPKYEDRHQQITSVNSKLQEFVNVYQLTCVSDHPDIHLPELRSVIINSVSGEKTGMLTF